MNSSYSTYRNFENEFLELFKYSSSERNPNFTRNFRISGQLEVIHKTSQFKDVWMEYSKAEAIFSPQTVSGSVMEGIIAMKILTGPLEYNELEIISTSAQLLIPKSIQNLFSILPECLNGFSLTLYQQNSSIKTAIFKISD
jgi:hypothetical protein